MGSVVNTKKTTLPRDPSFVVFFTSGLKGLKLHRF